MPNFFENPAIACPLPELRKRLDFDDARLLAECRVETRRVSGPGGQHRNKTESAIRLTHQPSGLVATGEERRSQHENKANAVERLREAIALTARVMPAGAIAWPENIRVDAGRLRVSERNPSVNHVIALVLDAWAAESADLKRAAARLGLTGSSLVKFLYDHPKAWREAGRMRNGAGLPPLRPPG